MGQQQEASIRLEVSHCQPQHEGSSFQRPVAQQPPSPKGGVLHVCLPSDEAAKMLASDESGIAQRAGVSLSSRPSCIAKAQPAVLEVIGQPPAAALACYLVQVYL